MFFFLLSFTLLCKSNNLKIHIYCLSVIYLFIFIYPSLHHPPINASIHLQHQSAVSPCKNLNTFMSMCPPCLRYLLLISHGITKFLFLSCNMETLHGNPACVYTQWPDLLHTHFLTNIGFATRISFFRFTSSTADPTK